MTGILLAVSVVFSLVVLGLSLRNLMIVRKAHYEEYKSRKRK